MQHHTVGDDISIRATLLLNNEPLKLGGYIVQAALTKPDKKTRATGTDIVDGVIASADEGIVDFMWPRAQTADITPGLYFLEVQVTAGGLRTTWDRVEVYLDPGAI